MFTLLRARSKLNKTFSLQAEQTRISSFASTLMFGSIQSWLTNTTSTGGASSDLPVSPQSQGCLVYVCWCIHWVNTARGCWEPHGVVSRFNAGQMCLRRSFSLCNQLGGDQRLFSCCFLFTALRGAGHLLSYTWRHFHT